MSCARAYLAIGTRVVIDGEIFEMTQFLLRPTGAELILTEATSAHRRTLAALLTSDRATLLADKASATDEDLK